MGDVTTHRATDAVPFDLTIPVRELTTGQSISCGFRVDMFEALEDGEKVGGAYSGGGFGNDWVHVEWRGRMFAFRAADVLTAVIAREFPDDLPMVAGQ